jgi:hypothetical protein
MIMIKIRVLESRASDCDRTPIPYASIIAYPPLPIYYPSPRVLCYYISGTRICGGWRGQVHYLALGEIPGGPSGADQAVRGDHLQRVEGRQCPKASPYLLSPSGSNPLVRLPL